MRQHDLLNHSISTINKYLMPGPKLIIHPGADADSVANHVRHSDAPVERHFANKLVDAIGEVDVKLAHTPSNETFAS